MKAIEDIMAERARQIADFGHTPEQDARLPVADLPTQARNYLIDALDLIMRRKPGWQGRAHKKLAKAGALILAAIDRIDMEQEES